MSLRIEIDRGRCTGHGRCYMLEPELFDVDDDGWPIVLVTDAEPLRERAVHAADNCPERAITLHEEASADR
ncbi:ferredoxin [Nocardia sp. alder85J]|uniref:ferredoxin n=1 Tax=Nocardia sp. alder85J TaxID=2862949 RepID=UPI001CD6C802|nr:ferredoxin [Nocardia sp. alder85J]MCX4092366.1 ferredoxin [Nocardia sp. alder85J]